MREARRRRSVSDALLAELLTGQLTAWRERTGRSECQVVDLGGGTGTLASVLADLGYAITVVDPSPDALASLQRRIEELRRQHQPDAAPVRIRGLQGDASELVGLLGSDAADVVVCHRVLDVIDDPAGALRSIAEVLRPGGALSLVTAQRRSAVLAQALAGHVDSARRIWHDSSRLDGDTMAEWVAAAGLEVTRSDGIGAIAGHVAESVVDDDSTVYATLLDLEREVSQDPAFRALAPWQHLFAELPPV